MVSPEPIQIFIEVRRPTVPAQIDISHSTFAVMSKNIDKYQNFQIEPEHQDDASKILQLLAPDEPELDFFQW